jgi:hypothetical protein
MFLLFYLSYLVLLERPQQQMQRGREWFGLAAPFNKSKGFTRATNAWIVSHKISFLARGSNLRSARRRGVVGFFLDMLEAHQLMRLGESSVDAFTIMRVAGQRELPASASAECVRTLISQVPVDPSFSLVSLLLGLACLGCP